MKRLFLILGLAVLLGAGGMLINKHNRSEAYAADCDTNAIISCGVADQQKLKDAYKANTTKDLAQIFEHYKITGAMINGVTAKQGTVYKNGDVKIGNELVATGAQSVGRHNLAGSTAITITKADGSKETIYQRKTSTSFVTDSIPALVFVDGNGKFVAAVLKSCGNPVVATPKPKPIYLCKSLQVLDVPSDRNKVSVRAITSLSDVTFKYITYTVKVNGKIVGQPIKATNQNAVTVALSQDGDYLIEATVTVDNAGKQVTSPVGGCTNAFKVVSPEYSCTKLTVTPTSDKTKFTLKPTVAVKNGATFKSIVYTVKDSTGATVFTSPAQGSAAYTVTQTKAGTYNVSAEATFDVLGQTLKTKDAACTGSFTVASAPVTPVYVCTSLTAQQNGDRTSFLFTPTLTLTNATFKNITYTVKDAQGKVVGTPSVSGSQAPFAYSQSVEGNYTVTAVATATVDGKEVTLTGNCTASFSVKPAPAQPKFECSKFTATPVVGQKMTYDFAVIYVAEGGAKLSKVAVDFDDSTTATDIPLSQLTSFRHTYAKAGNKSATATLTFQTGAASTDVADVTCTTKVDVQVEKCTLSGHTDEAADAATCKPCEFNSAIAADSPDCKKPVVLAVQTVSNNTPKELVNTGPADVIGLFASFTVAGAIAHRFIWMRRYSL